VLFEGGEKGQSGGGRRDPESSKGRQIRRTFSPKKREGPAFSWEGEKGGGNQSVPKLEGRATRGQLCVFLKIKKKKCGKKGLNKRVKKRKGVWDATLKRIMSYRAQQQHRLLEKKKERPEIKQWGKQNSAGNQTPGELLVHKGKTGVVIFAESRGERPCRQKKGETWTSLGGSQYAIPKRDFTASIPGFRKRSVRPLAETASVFEEGKKLGCDPSTTGGGEEVL